MLFRDTIKLIPMSPVQNATSGQIVDTEGTPREVFANKKSVRASEFYQALGAGLRPEIVFEVRLTDYSDEKRIEHNSAKYEVIRTYDKNGEFVEIVCQKIVLV
jgi:SPP1 family predicted phage head-tail adaptor